MNYSIRLIFLVPFVLVICAAIGSILWHWRTNSLGLNRQEIILCAMPSLLLLGLFYSLDLHMHQSLGGWPLSIGKRGFLPGLLVHVNIGTVYFGCLLLVTLFVLPAVFLVCLFVRRWQRWTVYFGLHVLSFIVCLGLMQLAPSPFLNWWID